MTFSQTDTARLTLALSELRMPAIKALWPRFAEQADKEGWPAARLLSTLNFVPVSGHWGTLPLSMKGAPNGTTSTELHGRV